MGYQSQTERSTGGQTRRSTNRLREWRGFHETPAGGRERGARRRIAEKAQDAGDDQMPGRQTADHRGRFHQQARQQVGGHQVVSRQAFRRRTSAWRTAARRSNRSRGSSAGPPSGRPAGMIQRQHRPGSRAARRQSPVCLNRSPGQERTARRGRKLVQQAQASARRGVQASVPKLKPGFNSMTHSPGRGA